MGSFKYVKASALFFLIAISAVLVGLVSLTLWLPSSQEIKDCLVTTMYEVDLCPTSKNYAPLNKISPYLQKTIVLTEDSNFYNHNGFEWAVIEKNFREGLESGSFKRGGSTITQQLAKNMFLSKDRTFFRKGLEALITDRIEKTLNKKEILERYLNVVEFGKNVYGIKSAANFYFKKSPAELDVVESAFFAMVLPSPIKYSRSYHTKELTPFARKRLNEIIFNMYQYHRINEEEYNVAVEKVRHFFNPAPPPDAYSSEDQIEGEELTLQDLENSLEEKRQNLDGPQNGTFESPATIELPEDEGNE